MLFVVGETIAGLQGIMQNVEWPVLPQYLCHVDYLELLF